MRYLIIPALLILLGAVGIFYWAIGELAKETRKPE
jgi:CHASE3 domain sensor protein